MPVMQLSNGRWRVQVRKKGFPGFDKVFATEGEARAAETAVLGKQQAVHHTAEITLQAAWERYVESQDFHQKSDHTQRTESARIQPVLRELGGYSLKNLEQAPHVIYDYIDQRSKIVSVRTKHRLSPTTIRLEIAALSAVVIWAQRRKLVHSNFVRLIQRPGMSKRKRRVPSREQAALDNAVVNFQLPMLAQAARFHLLLRHLGCRPGELAQVLRKDILMAKKELLYRNTKYRGEDRRVHITDRALGLLDAQLKYALENEPDSPFLFSTKSRRGGWVPYNYSWGVKLLRGYGVVGEDFHAHAMRREFISRAIEAGLNYSVIRKQTGHHSTQAIEIYDEGLSTAPEICKELDRLDASLSDELFFASFENMGATPEMISELKARLSGDVPSPFKRVYANGEQEDQFVMGKLKKDEDHS